MEFRPCIDIHNGQVKQIVGASLCDTNDYAMENFVSTQDGAFYGKLYKKMGLKGGHVILLNPKSSEYYEATKNQVFLALSAYPDGLMAGGGINLDNAHDFLEHGASHVIVTSYVFTDGAVNYERLSKLSKSVGKEHLVLDLSCRKKENDYYIVTDRWQKFTDEKITLETLDRLSSYCDEFLIHAADVEGKCQGIEVSLVRLLGDFCTIPITYAGGVGSYEDLRLLKEFGKNHVNVTIGSALDLFGGKLNFKRVLEICRE